MAPDDMAAAVAIRSMVRDGGSESTARRCRKWKLPNGRKRWCMQGARAAAGDIMPCSPARHAASSCCVLVSDAWTFRLQRAAAAPRTSRGAIGLYIVRSIDMLTPQPETTSPL